MTLRFNKGFARCTAVTNTMPSSRGLEHDKAASWPGRQSDKEIRQLRDDSFPRYAALGFPRIPWPKFFTKEEVISHPVAQAIAADLKEGGFTLANLRWLNRAIAAVRLWACT